MSSQSDPLPLPEALPEALPEDRSLRLPAHATTVTAEDLRVRLVLASDFDGEMAIDAGDVESVGQAVLQLLVAAAEEAAAQGKPFVIVNPSAAFIGRVAACRLSEALGLDIPEELVA
jgi:anti-anti-sigma regulatory factor